MKLLTVHHATTYRYARPVHFGPHRLMLRPRDSHDLRLIGAEIALSPPGGETRWMHDVFGNSVALVDFPEPASELTIVSKLSIERYALPRPVFPIAPEAQIYPFVYSAADRSDLGRLLERQYPDPRGTAEEWAKQFAGGFKPTYNVLSNINGAIRTGFTYAARDDEGTQSPLETLEKKSGTCRDFALLFIETVRSLGFGARFVSGYLYDPALDGGTSTVQGAGATHAWADVYIPGAGWVEYDPTNGTIAAENLIRVAVTRDPSQALPISGTFRGAPGDFLGMTIDVSVSAQET